MALLPPTHRSFPTPEHTLSLSLMNDIETRSSKGLVAQWKRIRLRIWGLQVRSLPSSCFFFFLLMATMAWPSFFCAKQHMIEKKSAPSRARTYDPGVISTMLYRLSYESSCEVSLDTLLFPVHSFSFLFLFDFSL